MGAILTIRLLMGIGHTHIPSHTFRGISQECHKESLHRTRHLGRPRTLARLVDVRTYHTLNNLADNHSDDMDNAGTGLQLRVFRSMSG